MAGSATILAQVTVLVIMVGSLFPLHHQLVEATTYTIGDPEYLRIFTKTYHQVWTEILSQGGYLEPDAHLLANNLRPNDGTESVFVKGMSPRPRRFMGSAFYNGSMFVFGGHDNNMYYNDLWEYRLPLFASDRSKWYEQISVWERDIGWLMLYNNRYYHSILKDVYESVCKDVFDEWSTKHLGYKRIMTDTPTSAPGGEAVVGAPENAYWSLLDTERKATTEGYVDWERDHPTDVIVDRPISWLTGEDGTTIEWDNANRPGFTHTQIPLEDQVPIEGGNPVNQRVRQQYAYHADDASHGFVKDGNWVCEEMRLRYDFETIETVRLKQDMKRPSSRFGIVMRTVFTDIDWKNTLPIETGAININSTDLTRISGNKNKPACLWSSHRMRMDGYSVPSYGGYTYSIPEGCRPQLVIFGGYDVNDYFMNDFWVYDIWNNTWTPTEPQRDRMRGLPRPRKFGSLNVYHPGIHSESNIHGYADGTFSPLGHTRKFSELIFLMGGYAAWPVEAFQDVWAYSREYGEWIDLLPRGRVPTARVYDAIEIIGKSAYIIGGTFGGFKIDVSRYNIPGNRFSLLYAAGAKPSARSHFSTTVFRDSIYLYGGRGWESVDDIDKQDTWMYNSTLNYWSVAEPTGVLPPTRQGHGAVTFGLTFFIFGGYGEPSGEEQGVGMMNDVWRFDIKLGPLLADNKFLENAGGWDIYQNSVEGDAVIPRHCDDYASKFGVYWGMPCRISYDQAAHQLLFVDGLHNDTVNATCSLLGCNGVGYLVAPRNYVRLGNQMYKGRLRYRYQKVYPTNEPNMQLDVICDMLWVNVPRIQDQSCGNWSHMTEDMSLVPVDNGRYLTHREQCDMKIGFYKCAQEKGCLSISRNSICTKALQECDIDVGVSCAPRRDAAIDTKDDILLVGRTQIMSFDILDELVPNTGRYTLVDVDLDEQKGWRIHGTNGSVIPTRDEFVHVLTTLQMILIRADYWPTFHFLNNTNYDHLGLIKEAVNPMRSFDNRIEGTEHDLTAKLDVHGGRQPYGTLPNRPGTEGSFWKSKGIWKYFNQSEAWEAVEKHVGRQQAHGEIVGFKSFEMFEASIDDLAGGNQIWQD